MSKRPLSITIIAWFLIVGGISTPILVTAVIKNSQIRETLSHNLLPVWLQYAVVYLAACMNLVSGVGFLKAKNWARYLYILSGLGFLTFFNVPSAPINPILKPLIFYAVVLFFLFRPQANEYFQQKTL